MMETGKPPHELAAVVLLMPSLRQGMRDAAEFRFILTLIMICSYLILILMQDTGMMTS